jgi:hypothetical protein
VLEMSGGRFQTLFVCNNLISAAWILKRAWQFNAQVLKMPLYFAKRVKIVLFWLIA